MLGERLHVLQNALLQAFPSEDALRELLLPMNLHLPTITLGRSLAAMMHEVIQYTDSHGRLDELVAGACKLRPHNTGFAGVVQKFWPDVPHPNPPPTAIERPRRDSTPGGLSSNDWDHMISHICEHKLTPVIGPCLTRGVIPQPGQLAAEWADKYQYPFADGAELTRVSQFLALTEYPLLPHKQLRARCAAAPVADLRAREDAHALLAEFDLPLYLTTNYDSLMTAAVAGRRSEVARAFPCWNQTLKEHVAAEGATAELARGPLVYHLFGHYDVPESMVLTEDDHFDFLAAVADPKLLPPTVKRAIGTTALLFVGFGVLDFGFRVLIRTLLKSITVKNGCFSVAVQIPPENLNEAQRAQVERYLDRFLNDSKFRFRVFWGDTAEFLRSLRDRWREQRVRDN